MLTAERRPWVSLMDLSADTLIQEWRGLVFSTYCDGRDGSGVTTLASVSADVSLWCAVEREWMRALADLHVDEWHTADAVGHAKGSEFVSWTLVDFVNAFNRLASEVLFQFRDNHLTTNMCSVIREDYNRFVLDFPDFKKTPEDLCVDVCVGGVQYATVPMAGPNEDETVPFVRVFFDENERFEHPIRRVWQEKRKRKGTIFHQIIQIGSVNSRYTPAVQIADLIAWTDHRAHTPNPIVGGDAIDARSMKSFLTLCIKSFDRLYDYDRLVKVRDEYKGLHGAP